MSRLDTYRAALQAADPRATHEVLDRLFDAQDGGFAAFVIDHGLGPLWHERSGRNEFHESRLAAEAFLLLQNEALRQVDALLSSAGIEHVVIKGAANRILLYANPALRACHDLDLLVRPADRLHAAAALASIGFVPIARARSISRVIVLTRGQVEIDLHWDLVREGRMRIDMTSDMVARRQRVAGTWVLSDEDTLFSLLVHPAFAKHLDAREMGLHRVADILGWLRQRSTDWPTVLARLEDAGVRTAAWATMRWVELLAGSQVPRRVAPMLNDLQPGFLRRAWLNYWLEANLPARTAGLRWLRLLAFSAFLHDTPIDALRALRGRQAARRRADDDLQHFSDLLGR